MNIIANKQYMAFSYSFHRYFRPVFDCQGADHLPLCYASLATPAKDGVIDV